MISSYPSIYNLGHPAVRDIFEYPVTIEEKIDGSQFSFWLDAETGLPCVKSKNQVMDIDAPQGLFRGACVTVLDLHRKGLLLPGYIYRGESMERPKHNSLGYDRTPEGNIVLFDIETEPHVFMSHTEKMFIAGLMGLEVAPLLFEGVLGTSFGKDALEAYLKCEPLLGGPMLEGLVVKAYGYYGPDKKTLMAKHVQEAFKEIHKKEWGAANPKRDTFLHDLAASFNTEARWQKAVLHLRELGEIEDSPRDIGKLIQEVKADCLKEGKDIIKDALYAHFVRDISRGFGAGVAEWYKDRLLEVQFGELGGLQAASEKDEVTA